DYYCALWHSSADAFF
nr:immunoglobulin light chain junction region [Macaca mulatta]